MLVGVFLGSMMCRYSSSAMLEKDGFYPEMTSIKYTLSYLSSTIHPASC